MILLYDSNYIYIYIYIYIYDGNHYRNNDNNYDVNHYGINDGNVVCKIIIGLKEVIVYVCLFYRIH